MLNAVSLLFLTGVFLLGSGIAAPLICPVGQLWDDTEGICKDCNPGFSGERCSQQCRFPNFGFQCQGICNCEEHLCNISNGCGFNDVTTYSVDRKERSCRAGYFGINCSWTCRYPNYGEDCQSKCDCKKSLCNMSYGCIQVSVESTEQTSLNSDHRMPVTKFSMDFIMLGTITSVGFLLVIISIIVTAVISRRE